MSAIGWPSVPMNDTFTGTMPGSSAVISLMANELASSSTSSSTPANAVCPGCSVIDGPSPGTSFCSTGIAAGSFAGLVKASFGQPWNVIGPVPWFVAVSRPRRGLPCMVSSAFTACFCLSLDEADVGASEVVEGASPWDAGVGDPQAVAPTASTAARIVRRRRGPLTGVLISIE